MLTRKHTSAVLFGGIIALPLIVLITLQIRQWYCIHSAEERLEKGALQTVIVPAEKFSWYRKGKEAIIADALFDVKSYSEKEGKVFLTGLFDEEETAIKKKLESDQSKSASPIVLLMAFIQSFIASEKNIYTQGFTDILKARFPSFTLFCPFAWSDVLIPPPKMV